ncbi:hypothetical protein [Vibrio vulnificus]|uniref:hypothetical protein n=1 Tax=Vibrio vulnificus TaxID=672 RepID=UPI001CBD7407|nr:hypothetical protein [Vibrio vulnificus]
MQVRFHDDFAKKQYKRLCGAYRQRNISRISCHFTNIVFRYGGQYASDLALFIQKTEDWKIKRKLGLSLSKESYIYFKAVSVSKNPYPIFKKIEQIRKQEEAPEALAVDGAESSRVGLGLAVKGVKAFEVKLCQLCKTGILTEQGDCPECNAMLG